MEYIGKLCHLLYALLWGGIAIVVVQLIFCIADFIIDEIKIRRNK